MLIQILIDNERSWIIPYAYALKNKIVEKGIDCDLFHTHGDIQRGDILILLSCEKIFENLQLNKYNLVVHESALPQGKGWSPLTWQILEGKNKIPVTLFEAAKKIDSGVIYSTKNIELEGHELIDELRNRQGKATIDLVMDFISNYPNNVGVEQIGEESFYPRRTSKDSLLDLNKNLREQFNLLRVCDNEQYPAWFEINGTKYILKIYKD